MPAAAVDAIVARTTHTDPQYAKMRRMALPTEGLTPKITTHDCEALKEGKLVVWRGALGDVIRILKRYKVTPVIDDQRLWLTPVDFGSTIKLRDYQEEPFNIMCRRQQTVGRGAAGSGKTEMLLAAAAWFQQPTLVLVWQQRQQQVWLERIARYFSIEPGGIGGAFKHETIMPITVGMIQSVRNRMDRVPSLFGCVICDEVQRFAAGTFREVVNAMPAAVRLGASDDERRRDKREFLLYDSFGPRGWTLAPNEGQCPVDIFAVPTKFKYKVLMTPRGPDLDWTDLVETMTTDEGRNRLIIDLCCNLVHKGQRVLVWSDRVEHCLWLKRALMEKGVAASLLIGGKQYEEESNATEAGLQSGLVQVGIGTSVAEQSINIPSLVAGVMTCASADPDLYRFQQMRGRLARPDPNNSSKRGQLYYLWDHRVPVLKGKINNVRRRYPVKVPRRRRPNTTKDKQG